MIGLGSGIAGASQLPQSWTKPIVDSVVLPVHATTSDGLSSFAGVAVSSDPQNGATYQICITCENGVCSAQVLESYPGDPGSESYFYVGSGGSIGSVLILTQPEPACDSFTVRLTISSAADLALGKLELIDGGAAVDDMADFSVPQGSCGISAADATCTPGAKALLKSQTSPIQHH